MPTHPSDPLLPSSLPPPEEFPGGKKNGTSSQVLKHMAGLWHLPLPSEWKLEICQACFAEIFLFCANNDSCHTWPGDHPWHLRNTKDNRKDRGICHSSSSCIQKSVSWLFLDWGKKRRERKWGCNAVGTTLAWEPQFLHLKNGAIEPPHGLYCKAQMRCCVWENFFNYERLFKAERQ